FKLSLKNRFVKSRHSPNTGRKICKEKNMTKSYKLSAALILSGALASAGVAGESGAFVGVELGAGILTSTQAGSGTYEATTGGGTATTSVTASEQQGGATLGLDWGIRVGYQLYFTPTHGARVYASYGMAHVYPYSLSGESGANTVSNNTYITGQRIDINIDYLVDFIKAENASAGVYAGIFAGYAEYAENSVIKVNGNTINDPDRTSPTQFYGGVGLGLNLGIQTTLAKHHRIEFGAKIPFLGPTYRVGLNSPGLPVYQYYKYASVGASYAFVF
ncbi:hypothetical protein BA723_08940, partial [Helicobacter sp. CLO-3]